MRYAARKSARLNGSDEAHEKKAVTSEWRNAAGSSPAAKIFFKRVEPSFQPGLQHPRSGRNPDRSS
jgi:hypothetical protein